jgi:hypothetical protein
MLTGGKQSTTNIVERVICITVYLQLWATKTTLKAVMQLAAGTNDQEYFVMKQLQSHGSLKTVSFKSKAC